MTTVEMLGREAPSVQRFLLSWLQALDGPDHVGTERKPKQPFPFYMVNRVAGTDDLFSDEPIASVHVYGQSDDLAELAMKRMHQRVLYLAENAADIVMPDGSLANCNDAWCSEYPTKQPYSATDLYRYVGRYGFSFALI